LTIGTHPKKGGALIENHSAAGGRTMVITVLQVLILFATIGVGLLAFFAPLTAANFTGLQIPGPRGRTEVRAIFGGVFIGLGLAPLLLPGAGAYQSVGFTYLVLGVSRLIGLIMDRSADQSNWLSLLVEFVFGFLLFL
jgi:hypothetical protein